MKENQSEENFQMYQRRTEVGQVLQNVEKFRKIERVWRGKLRLDDNWKNIDEKKFEGKFEEKGKYFQLRGKRDLLGGFTVLNMYKHYSRRTYDTSTPKLTTIIDS